MPGGAKRKRDELENPAGAGVGVAVGVGVAAGPTVGATASAGVDGVGVGVVDPGANIVAAANNPAGDAPGKGVVVRGTEETSFAKSSLAPRGLNLVRKIVSKACANPAEEKYRRINPQSRVLREALGQSAEVVLGLLGFAKQEEDAVWYLPEEKCSLLGDRLRDIEMHFEVGELGMQKGRNVPSPSADLTSGRPSSQSLSSSSLPRIIPKAHEASSSSTSSHGDREVTVYCDVCGKCRRCFGAKECDIVEAAAKSNQPWTCSALSHRIPEQCKEPDDELKDLVGAVYASVLDHLGIRTRVLLAGADANYLVQEAGGAEFLPLVLDWIARAQSTEIADKMVEIFDDDHQFLDHLRLCGVSNPGDMLDQTAETMQTLLQDRCGLTKSLESINVWRNSCKVAIRDYPWMRHWVHRPIESLESNGFSQ